MEAPGVDGTHPVRPRRRPACNCTKIVCHLVGDAGNVVFVMPTNREPELHVIEFPAGAGEELRAQAERHRAEGRTRYLAHLSHHLTESDAAIALDALTVWNNITSGDRCGCSCHPGLPESDFHDYGFDCPCRQTPDTRRRRWDEWTAELDAFWASPEGQQIVAEREAEEEELTAWLDLHPKVLVESHGGMFPEQWRGEVDGQTFYFRERNGRWRIELDLRPTGQFSKVWVGGDFDDPASFEPRSIDVGEIIAEGTTAAPGYGRTPLDRLHFIIDVIRAHTLRQSCTVHIEKQAALTSLLGQSPAWCPSCGTGLSPAVS
jgi:hypothetical protein